MEITKQTTLGDILANYSNAPDILMGFGMHCFSCPVSQMETVEEACAVHDLDCDFVISKLKEDLLPNQPKNKT